MIEKMTEAITKVCEYVFEKSDIIRIYAEQGTNKERLPLTDMWYINGQVESVVLRRKAEDFSVVRTDK